MTATERETVGPVFKDLTVTAEAKLIDTVAMANESQPDRQFLPEKISVHYWPGPDGWQLSSVLIVGRTVLKSGKIGKNRRCAYYASGLGGRPGDLHKCPAWAREFADLHCPEDGAR